MRNSALIEDIISNSTITYTSIENDIAYALQSSELEDETVERVRNVQNRINNVLYAISFQNYLSLQQQDLLADYLIRSGYYQKNNNTYFSEIIFNDQSFDTY